MKLKLARFAQVAAMLAAAVALASPALVNAGPHGSGGHAHFSGGRAGGHAFAGRGFAGRANVGRGYAGHAYVGRGYAGHAFVGHRSVFGPRVGYHPNWRGGWWRGYYWPRAYYGWDYPWFLAALPLGFVTYWWSGIPYYYVNNVYYAWDPDDDGYVVTNPPPVGDGGDSGDSGSWYSDPPANGASSPSAVNPSATASGPRGPDDVYMYPEHGQTAQQQSTDRYECHQWAQQQTGFDPTQSASESSGGSAEGYHRALVACLTGRGYSVD